MSTPDFAAIKLLFLAALDRSKAIGEEHGLNRRAHPGTASRIDYGPAQAANEAVFSALDAAEAELASARQALPDWLEKEVTRLIKHSAPSEWSTYRDLAKRYLAEAVRLRETTK
jgi:hypothetical protein